jgi:hypothetical protein
MRVLNNEVVMAVILVGILAIFVMRAIVHVVRQEGPSAADPS